MGWERLVPPRTPIFDPPGHPVAGAGENARRQSDRFGCGFESLIWHRQSQRITLIGQMIKPNILKLLYNLRGYILMDIVPTV